MAVSARAGVRRGATVCELQFTAGRGWGLGRVGRLERKAAACTESPGPLLSVGMVAFRARQVRTIPTPVGVYALCDVDEVPVYIGQSTDGIRVRVQRHLTSARSDVITNRQIDVWEIAYVWAWPIGAENISALEAHLFYEFDSQSALMNGTVPAPPGPLGSWNRPVTDRYDTATRSRVMAAVRSRDTAPEVAVRKALHAAGYRFRLHGRDLPGSPDVVLPRHRLAVFVHGCFWHGHGCSRAKRPATNARYWDAKRQRNCARDAMAQKCLRRAGWRVAIVWTCQQDADTARLLRRLARGVDHRREVVS